MNRKLAISILVACVGMTQLAAAQSNPLTNFPMIGVTRAQTLRINLYSFPPNPCTATLGFQDSNGNPLGTTKSVTLQAGQSAALAISGTSLTSVKDHLVEVLPTVVVNGTETSCVATAEVFTTSSGVTNVLVPGEQPQPEPSFGQLAVTSVETLRLNVVAFPPNPCDGTLSFLNSAGAVVGNTLSVQLAPGQAALLDLPGSTVVTKSGQRAEVTPVVSGSGGSSCIASVEVFANSTEIQTAFYPPTPCAPGSTSCVTF